jgi:hypothetical protein
MTKLPENAHSFAVGIHVLTMPVGTKSEFESNCDGHLTIFFDIQNALDLDFLKRGKVKLISSINTQC